MTLRDGLYVGLAQVLALAPGTSRSGITITAARYLGFDRDSSARVSFLLLIPAVFGATVYSAYKAIHDGLPNDVAGPIIVGTIASAISGYIAIAWLLRLVRTHSYRPFVIYRYFAGAGVLLLIATGVRSATFG
jgi:undecaprenyl-diphosphatase